MLAVRPTIFFALVLACCVFQSHSLELQRILDDVTSSKDDRGGFVGVGFDLTASYG